jgi:hypothetical protein
MHRSPNQLKPFDETDPAFIIAREAIGKWAARCNLNRNPEMPAGFRARTADNWRCLVAIADDLGFGYDEVTRAAAVALGSDRQYENQHITLLTDIRTAFDRRDKDRLRTKAELIPALAGLEDSPWGEWTGLDGTAGPHTLRKVISAACSAPSPSDRRRRRDDARERNQRADIPVSNSSRHGPPIATQAPHRHRQANSGTCRGREPPHARHTFGGRSAGLVPSMILPL